MFIKQNPNPAVTDRPPMKFFHASGERPVDGFTIKRGIGAGGFGEVYFAMSDAGKEVALKRVQRNLDVELRGVRQCLNLKHPNLLSLYDIRHDDAGQTWIVMEYMAGDNLQQLIEQHPDGLSLDQVRHWLTGIVLGIEALHDQGIVHRDLKPGNVFMDCGFVKIGDYGLSKFISCSRRSGHTESVGTFHYMAPEIGRGCYGKEIDIYALGVMIYEMLTGRVPFNGESSQEIIMKHLTSQPDLRGLPSQYASVIARCLAKDPQHRPQSATEILQALQLQGPASAPRTHHAAGDFREPVLLAELVPEGIPEEPLWRATRKVWSEFQWRWRQAQLPVTLQIAAVVGVLVLGLGTLISLFPALITLWLVYLGYYVVWRLVNATPAPPDAAQPVTLQPAPMSPPMGVPLRSPAPMPNAAKPQTTPKKLAPTKVNWQLHAREQLRGGRRVVHSVTQLTKSWLMAAVVTAVVSVLGLLVASGGLKAPAASWGATYGWIFFTTLVASWGLLAIAKPWEGFPEDPALKRFSQLVLGLLVGAAAFGLSEAFFFHPDYLVAVPPPFRHELPSALYQAGGTPTFYGYLGHFAGLFALVRWWRLSDPFRHHRLALWPTGLLSAAAVVWHFCLPMPLGVLIATTVALTVQLSAPWVHHDLRENLRQQAQRAADTAIVA